MMSIAKQLAKEFSFPLVAAVAWTFYSSSEGANFKEFVTIFGPAFFLASWLTGQVFRVLKQEGLQTGLTVLKTQLEKLVGQLEEKTQEMIHYTTGGDSICYFIVGVDEATNASTWTIVHQGQYPLYGVLARRVDLEKFGNALRFNRPLHEADEHIAVGDLSPHQAAPLYFLDLSSGPARSFNVFFSARNGFFTQRIRFRRVSGQWKQASAVTKKGLGDEPVFQQVDPEYPLDESGKPEGL